ncbi:MAG: hypothetical protein J6I65_00845 [Lachnospiraceae bacterium]|nr:hypothetical protein [Lachnospiraceae bacterium]
MNKKEDKIYREIFSILCEHCGDKEISDNMSILKDLKLDSIEIISLILEIEKKYEITFVEYDKLFEAIDSVQAFIMYFVRIVLDNREEK